MFFKFDELIIEDTCLQPNFFKNILNALRSGRIDYVELDNCQIDDVQALQLIEVVKNTPAINSLVLINNDITYFGFAAILERLNEIPHLKNIDLGGNFISCEKSTKQAQKLIKNLSVDKIDLDYLGLSCNELHNHDAEFLIKFLQTNVKINHLNLSENNLGKLAPKLVAAAIKNKHLESIDLGNNNLKDSFVDAIYDLYYSHDTSKTNLKFLELKGNYINHHKSWEKLLPLLVDNKLTMIDVRDNSFSVNYSKYQKVFDKFNIKPVSKKIFEEYIQSEPDQIDEGNFLIVDSSHDPETQVSQINDMLSLWC